MNIGKRWPLTARIVNRNFIRLFEAPIAAAIVGAFKRKRFSRRDHVRYLTVCSTNFDVGT
jgi:hypothetical protein